MGPRAIETRGGNIRHCVVYSFCSAQLHCVICAILQLDNLWIRRNCVTMKPSASMQKCCRGKRRAERPSHALHHGHGLGNLADPWKSYFAGACLCLPAGQTGKLSFLTEVRLNPLLHVSESLTHSDDLN